MENIESLLKILNLNEETLIEKVIDNLSEKLFKKCLENKYAEDEYGDHYIIDDNILDKLKNSVDKKINLAITSATEKFLTELCKEITEPLIKEKITNFMVDKNQSLDDFIKNESAKFLNQNVDKNGNSTNGPAWSDRVEFTIKQILRSSYREEVEKILKDIVSATIDEVNEGVIERIKKIKDRKLEDIKICKISDLAS